MGPIIGTMILAPLPFLLQQYDTLKDVVYGALIIAVIVMLPAGIYGEVKRRVVLSLRMHPDKHTFLARVLQ
jgi:branched-chain amino acid transport system permease protein